MVVLTLGKPVGQMLIQMPLSTLTESVPGKHYHIRIETQGTLGKEEEIADKLVNGLYTEFKAKVKYVRVDDYNIDLQLEGSPFAWALLLPWIPTILGAIGILLTLVAIYSVIAAVPRWAWATLAIGVVLLFFGPAIGKSLIKPVKV